MDLGEVYRLAGRREDAVRAARAALEVAEAKSVAPLIERILGRLSELETTTE